MASGKPERNLGLIKRSGKPGRGCVMLKDPKHPIRRSHPWRCVQEHPKDELNHQSSKVQLQEKNCLIIFEDNIYASHSSKRHQVAVSLKISFKQI